MRKANGKGISSEALTQLNRDMERADRPSTTEGVLEKAKETALMHGRQWGEIGVFRYESFWPTDSRPFNVSYITYYKPGTRGVEAERLEITVFRGRNVTLIEASREPDRGLLWDYKVGHVLASKTELHSWNIPHLSRLAHEAATQA